MQNEDHKIAFAARALSKLEPLSWQRMIEGLAAPGTLVSHDEEIFYDGEKCDVYVAVTVACLILGAVIEATYVFCFPIIGEFYPISMDDLINKEVDDISHLKEEIALKAIELKKTVITLKTILRASRVLTQITDPGVVPKDDDTTDSTEATHS